MTNAKIAFFGDVSAVPSAKRFEKTKIDISKTAPSSVECLGIPIGTSTPVPAQLGIDRASLSAAGFEGKVGQTLVLPRKDGPTVVVLGIGSPAELTPATLRDVAAAFARAAGNHAHLATNLTDAADMPDDIAAQSVVEGVLLAAYRYDAFKSKVDDVPLVDLHLLASPERARGMGKGVERGLVSAHAAMLGRDLANTPPSLMNTVRVSELAAKVASASGLGIEVFDKDALVELGCGGLLGVNRGSADPPRMIKLTYHPKGAHAHGKGAHGAGHLVFVGKGVTYDAGGISLKPNDEMHAQMKLDMSGAAAVLASMSALSALDCKTRVTGFLMCTDNMPSSKAMKLGDVLMIRGGKTIEVKNTDAEGRLMLADGLVLATEERPDAIVNIATLTGACMRALGLSMAGVFGNHQGFIDQVVAAGARADEPVWPLPLNRKLRKELDSPIADMKNVSSSENAAAITAALFLAEFVGKTPWAHIDICGPMRTETDDSWRSAGATAFGVRLLVDLALNFSAPGHSKV